MKNIGSVLIDPKEVYNTLLDCFYTREELIGIEGKPKDAIMVKSISWNLGLHPDRLEAKREQVKTWLEVLPKSFRQNVCGCRPFLNAAFQEDKIQWTNSLLSIEELLVLATALRLATPSPRIIWPYLPAGMPLYTINIE